MNICIKWPVCANYALCKLVCLRNMQNDFVLLRNVNTWWHVLCHDMVTVRSAGASQLITDNYLVINILCDKAHKGDELIASNRLFMSISVQCLSSRFLKVLTIGALVTAGGSLLHSLITRMLNNICLAVVLHLDSNSLRWYLVSSTYVWQVLRHFYQFRGPIRNCIQTSWLYTGCR